MYEYLITNLPFSFDMNDLKDCYHWRWGIEITFRYLKHANGMLHFHSRKTEFLKQEIYANLILYNFGIFLANEAAHENQAKKRKDNNKYEYHINISDALRLARLFFLRTDHKRDNCILKLIGNYVHAVKTKVRSFPRHMRGIGAIRFGYR